MGKFLFTGAQILALDPERPDYFTGDLLIEGDRITAIREEAGLIERQRADRVIEGRDLLLMPGMINTHGHAAMTLLRGYADDLPLKEWLEEKIWPVEEILTETIFTGDVAGYLRDAKRRHDHLYRYVFLYGSGCGGGGRWQDPCRTLARPGRPR